MLVVLSLSASVVVLGLVSTYREIRGAELRTRIEAERQAAVLAADLRRALGQAEVLARFEPGERFEVDDGRLVIPADVGWVDELPPDPPMTDVLGLSIDLVQSAERLAREGKPDEAARRFGEALRVPSSSPRALEWARLSAAWFHHRQGRPGERDALIEELSTEPPQGRAVLAGLLTLRLEAGHRLPEWSAAAIARLPPLEAEALCQRLGAPARQFAAVVAEVQQARATLLLARSQLDFLGAGDAPFLRPVGTHLLVFFPGPERCGQGAVFRPERLLSVLAHLLDSTGAEVVIGEPAPLAAVPAVPLVAVMPRAADLAAGPLRALGLPGLMLAVVLFLLLSVVATLRALQAQTRLGFARADFLTGVTHELRTPLAAIRLLVQMLREGRVASPEKREEYYGRLDEESLRLERLIGNVLERRAGAPGPDRAVVRIDALCEEAVERFRPLAERAGLQLQVSLQAGFERPADRQALIQALLNLFDNACKYAADGGRLEIDGCLRARDYCIRVSDSGPGIPAAEREQVFERFRRGSRHASGNIPGMGLGLDLSRTTFRAHGGDLRVEPSPEGTGACFVATVPGPEA